MYKIFYITRITKNIYPLVKRLLDFIFSLFFVIFLIPVFLLCITIIYFTMGKPIFFIQERGGYKNKIFKLIKFRTMTLEVNNRNELLSDSRRITKFGKFLRETSLDEIPSLLNVIKGDMSFIGPRPLLSQYISLYNKEQNKRHLIRPGITGLAQISGRNMISWEKKFELDVWYVKNFNFFLDTKIFFLTIIKVINKEGTNKNSNTTMTEFKGSKE